MKILIAPNAFKGSLSAMEVADAIAEGILEAFPKAEVIKVPPADGGDGTAEVLCNLSDGRMVNCETEDPLARTIVSSHAIPGDKRTVVIEMAKASGVGSFKKRGVQSAYELDLWHGCFIYGCNPEGI